MREGRKCVVASRNRMGTSNEDVLPYVSSLAAATNSSGLKLTTPGNPSPPNCPFCPWASSYFRLFQLPEWFEISCQSTTHPCLAYVDKIPMDFYVMLSARLLRSPVVIPEHVDASVF